MNPAIEQLLARISDMEAVRKQFTPDQAAYWFLMKTALSRVLSGVINALVACPEDVEMLTEMRNEGVKLMVEASINHDLCLAAMAESKQATMH